MNPNSEDPNWWLLVDDDFLGPDKVEEDGMDSEGYVVVNQEDFVDGIASFLAKYISAMPEAKVLILLLQWQSTLSVSLFVRSKFSGRLCY